MELTKLVRKRRSASSTEEQHYGYYSRESLGFFAESRISTIAISVGCSHLSCSDKNEMSFTDKKRVLKIKVLDISLGLVTEVFIKCNVDESVSEVEKLLQKNNLIPECNEIFISLYLYYDKVDNKERVLS